MKKYIKSLLLITMLAGNVIALDYTDASNLANGLTPAVFIKTAGSKFYICVHDPRTDVNKLIICKDSPSNIIRDITWMYDAAKKTDNKHEMESAEGKFIWTIAEKLKLKPKTSYSGSPIIDEYNKRMPMYWFLSNGIKDLKKIEEVFEQNNVEPNETLLILEIANDYQLTSLEPADWAFLYKYFTMPSGKNGNKLYSFLAESKKSMLEVTGRTEAAKPEPLFGKDLRKYVAYDVQKWAKEFNPEKYGPYLLKAAVTYYLFKRFNIWSVLENAVKAPFVKPQAEESKS